MNARLTTGAIALALLTARPPSHAQGVREFHAQTIKTHQARTIAVHRGSTVQKRNARSMEVHHARSSHVFTKAEREAMMRKTMQGYQHSRHRRKGLNQQQIDALANLNKTIRATHQDGQTSVHFGP